MFGMRTMMNDMRSRLVGHELTPKLIAHAFPEGLENIDQGLLHALHMGMEEHTATIMVIVMGIRTKRMKVIAMLCMGIHMHLIGILLIRMGQEQ